MDCPDSSSCDGVAYVAYALICPWVYHIRVQKQEKVLLLDEKATIREKSKRLDDHEEKTNEIQKVCLKVPRGTAAAGFL
jgi:hypothetical protein